jgi:predicted amidohydrolase YtcJ
MQADLAVLSGDPRATPSEALTDLRVTQTWVGGQQVYEDESRSPAGARGRP